MKKRLLLAMLTLFLMTGGSALAECNDCPDLMELFALNCPRCFGGGTHDPDPFDDPPPDPDRSNIVTCVAKITDIFGEPAQGVLINMMSHGDWSDPGPHCSANDALYDPSCLCYGDPACMANDPGYTTAQAFTDVNGYAFLQVWAEPDWNMDHVYCEAYPEGDPAHVRESYGSQSGPRITNYVSLVIGDTDDPTIPNIPYATPDEVYTPIGLDPTTEGRAHLYTSGPIDRVVVLVEPFGYHTDLDNNWDWIDWFQYYGHMILPMHDLGYDIWLFEPSSSGDNAYEQASELAELIQYAHSQQPADDVNGTEREIVVVGSSTGGLIARTALARWTDTVGNSQAWRDALGLAAAPPVRLLTAIDSPLSGGNFPKDLQKQFHQWNRDDDYQLDSCFARQFLKTWCDSVNCSSSGQQNFFLGTGSVPGACSSNLDLMHPREIDGTIRGANSLSGDGYPDGIRFVASSNGAFGQRNQCYADDRDENAAGSLRRGNGGSGPSGRICGGIPPHTVDPDDWDGWVQTHVNPVAFSSGDTMIEIDINETCADISNRLGLTPENTFEDIKYTGWDSVAGSRHDLQLQEEFMDMLVSDNLATIGDFITIYNWVNLFIKIDSIGDLLDFTQTNCNESLGVSQAGMGTKVPITSAFDIRSCSSAGAACQNYSVSQMNSNGVELSHPAIDATCSNDHGGTHDRIYTACQNFVVSEIDAAMDLESDCEDIPGAYCFPECGDGICQLSETAANCCSDCGNCCPNGQCDNGENYNTCSLDCEAPVCGDLQCTHDETQGECCIDCGGCGGPYCGDGICDTNENYTTCPADCTAPGAGCKKNCVNQQ